MAKLRFAVAALVAVSFAGTRLQAQDAQQFATLDQPAVVQEAPTAVAEALPLVAEVPIEAAQSETATLNAPLAALAEIPVADVPLAELPAVDVSAPVAQEAAPIAAEVVIPTGPSMNASSLSPRLQDRASLSANSFRRPSGGAGVGLMILGGAALITGLIIGNNAGTVIAVGGALIGLYGLYVYLGRPSGMEQGSRIGLGYKLATN